MTHLRHLEILIVIFCLYYFYCIYFNLITGIINLYICLSIVHPKEANSFRKLDVWNDNDASFPRTSLLATNNADKDDNDDFKHSLEFFREDAQSTNLNKANDIIDLLKNNVIQFCPVCLKKNITNQTTVFLPHLKNCAAKNKVSTDQLLKAIELQQKQTIERAALGLPAVIQDKSAPKRPIVRKVSFTVVCKFV